jgi:hypothetical protein
MACAQKHLVLPDEDTAAPRSRRSDALRASTANGCSSGGASSNSREGTLGALLAPDCESVELNARPRGSRGSARENLPLEGKLGRQPASDAGGAIREKAMEPWKGTPKPAMIGNKPATSGNKPGTSSAKPAQSSCCNPSSSAKKPTTKK